MAHSVFLLTVGSLLFVYLCNDKTVLHFSRTGRRIYWALLSAILSWWLIWTLKAIDVHGTESLWLVMSAVFAASWVEDEVQKSFTLTPFRSPAIANVRGSPEAEGKAELIDAVVASITRWQGYTGGVSRIVSRVAGSLRKYRSAIHEVLRGADKVELNYLLVRVNAAALVEVVGRATMDELTGPRLSDLSVLSRAALLDALQKVGMRHRPMRQRWALALLRATAGADLTRLKAFIDDGGDYHTIYKLIYHDLQGALHREAVAHLTAEGERAYADFAAECPDGPPGIALKVVSDIDDTLMSSGGAFPAGCDARLPRHCVYPGAVAFLNELDTGHVLRIQACRRAAARAHSPRSAGADIVSGSATASTAHGMQAEEAGAPANMADGGARADAETAMAGDGAAAAIAARRSAGVDGPTNGVGGKRWAPAPAPPQMTRSGRRRLVSPMQGGESREAQARWQDRPHQRWVHLVFLSARPESFKGLTEALSLRRIFRPLVERGEMLGYPVLLLGSLRSGPRALWDYARGSRPLQDSPATLNTQLYIQLYERKLARFAQFAMLYPEYCWVFVGDNGQGDMLVAEKLGRLLRRRDGRCALVASFVHRVAPLLGTITSLRARRTSKAAWLAAWRDLGIHVHRTFVGMSVEAYTLGLVDARGLHHCVLEAARDLRCARARYAFEPVDWMLLVRQLNADIDAANRFLPDDLQVSPLQLPEAPSGSASADSDASAGPLRGGVRRRHGAGRLPRVRTPTAASDGDSSDAGSSVKGASPVQGASPLRGSSPRFGPWWRPASASGYKSDASSAAGAARGAATAPAAGEGI
ncbi:hypothetical protein WJX81_006378 [Elliptochloris bilobata]|uniref:Phosphatidate phosphatase APP1 catalytic domain-containing protein n=1 Tax=Elliptochloris bilobata TaxID=381761 RepID=A0AAW1QVF1_9CHLO